MYALHVYNETDRTIGLKGKIQVNVDILIIIGQENGGDHFHISSFSHEFLKYLFVKHLNLHFCVIIQWYQSQCDI